MSPARMCSLATSTARWYMPSGIELRTSGGASPGTGGSVSGTTSGWASFAAAARTRSHASSYSRSTSAPVMCRTGTLSIR